MADVLVVKLGAIGDLVMATPALQAVRERHHGSKVVLLTGTWSAPAVAGNPSIDETIVVDERIFWKPDPGALLRLLCTLRRRRFQTAYIMHWSPLFALFAAAAGIPERIGFRRGRRGWFLTQSAGFTEGVPGTHAIAQYRALVTAAPGGDVPRAVFMLSDQEREWAGAWCAAHGLGADRVLIGVAPGGGDNPRSSMPLRRWPIGRFRETVRLLLAADPALAVILLGGARERELCETVCYGLDPVRVTVAAGGLSLRESAAVLSRCACLLCNDSGLMHLAGALDVPTVAVFGPTAPWDKLPPGPLHRALYAPRACSPCYRFGRFPGCQDPGCLRDIRVDAAAQAVHEALAAQRTPLTTPEKNCRTTIP